MRISDWSSDVCSSDLRVEHRFGVRLELVQRVHLGAGGLFGLDDLEREEAHRLGALSHHADEAVVHEVDLVHTALSATAVVGVDEGRTDLLRGAELRGVGVTGPLRLGGEATELEVAHRLAPDEVEGDLFAL